MKIAFVNWSGLTGSETIFCILAGSKGVGGTVPCTETRASEQKDDHAVSDSLAASRHCHCNEESTAEIDMALACYDGKQSYRISSRWGQYQCFLFSLSPYEESCLRTFHDLCGNSLWCPHTSTWFPCCSKTGLFINSSDRNRRSTLLKCRVACWVCKQECSLLVGTIIVWRQKNVFGC